MWRYRLDDDGLSVRVQARDGGVTELATLTRAAKCMAGRHPEWTPEQCEAVVREVVAFLEPDLVLRGLYDSVKSEMERARAAA